MSDKTDGAGSLPSVTDLLVLVPSVMDLPWHQCQTEVSMLSGHWKEDGVFVLLAKPMGKGLLLLLAGELDTCLALCLER
jgi:hypothetical protein